MKDGSGDAWVSDKVSSVGPVKSQDKDTIDGPAKVITDAKDRITGTPKKFDPMQMMRNGSRASKPSKAVGFHRFSHRERVPGAFSLIGNSAKRPVSFMTRGGAIPSAPVRKNQKEI